MLCTTDPKASQNGTQHHDAVAANTGGTATCPVNSTLQKYQIWVWSTGCNNMQEIN